MNLSDVRDILKRIEERLAKVVNLDPHSEQAMLSGRSLYVAQNGTVQRCSILHISRVSVEESAT